MRRYAVTILVLTIGFLCVDPVLAKTVKRYYPNGALEAVVRYDKKGKRNGPYKTYWPNGKIKEKGFNKNGKPTGSVQQWNMDGDRVL